MPFLEITTVYRKPSRITSKESREGVREGGFEERGEGTKRECSPPLGTKKEGKGRQRECLPPLGMCVH